MEKLSRQQQQAMVEELVATVERFHREMLGIHQAYEAIDLEIDASGKISILIHPKGLELPHTTSLR